MARRTVEKIRSINQETIRRINDEVALRAWRFANTLFSGVFRAIFHVERAYEFTEPEVFQLDFEPDRIMWKRFDAFRLRQLPLAIANEDVLASRYQLFTEYDFVVAVDVSQSMMLNWWGAYGGPTASSHPMRSRSIEGDCTKLFLLKYVLSSFLHAARANDFYSSVLLAGDGTVREYDSRRERNLEETVLTYIDEHYCRVAEHGGRETPKLAEALRRIATRRRRAIVLCLSDFRETLQHVYEPEPTTSFQRLLLPLAEISTQHRVLALQILDRLELDPQEEDVSREAKDTACVNPGRWDENEVVYPKNDQLAQHNARVRMWNRRLEHGMSRYGIKFDRLVAGRDDARIDKRIYELGTVTEM